MDENDRARERLRGAQWGGLEQMIREHAAAAIAVARADFRETLNWELEREGGTGDGSLGRLEHILNRLSPAPEPLETADGEWWSLLWGSYLGELLRRRHGGSWEMTLYPGSVFSVPTLVVEGSRLYPMMKVHRRLSLGVNEGLPAFYAMVRARLGAAPPAADTL